MKVRSTGGRSIQILYSSSNITLKYSFKNKIVLKYMTVISKMYFKYQKQRYSKKGLSWEYCAIYTILYNFILLYYKYSCINVWVASDCCSRSICSFYQFYILLDYESITTHHFYGMIIFF